MVSFKYLLTPTEGELKARMESDMRAEVTSTPTGHKWECVQVGGERPAGSRAMADAVTAAHVEALLKQKLNGDVREDSVVSIKLKTPFAVEFEWPDVICVFYGLSPRWFRHQGWRGRAVNTNLDEADYEHCLSSLLPHLPYPIQRQSRAVRRSLHHFAGALQCKPERLVFVTARQSTESIACLHYDDYHNLCLVLAGRKTWFFLSPDDGLGVKQRDRSSISTMDVGGPENVLTGISPSSHPHLPWLSVDQHVGDVLYVPPGWWHYVMSDATGTISTCIFWKDAKWNQPHGSGGSGHSQSAASMAHGSLSKSTGTVDALPPSGPTPPPRMPPMQPAKPGDLALQQPAPAMAHQEHVAQQQPASIRFLLNADGDLGPSPSKSYNALVARPDVTPQPHIGALPSLRTIHPHTWQPRAPQPSLSFLPTPFLMPSIFSALPTGLTDEHHRFDCPLGAVGPATPARDVQFHGYGGFCKDGCPALHKSALDSLARPDDRFQHGLHPLLEINCFAHGMMHLQKKKALLKNTRNYNTLFNDMTSLNQNIMTSRAVTTAVQLMLQKWTDMGEIAMANCMETYFNETGGATPRCVANIMHGGGMPSDNNGLESRHKNLHHAILAKTNATQHVRHVVAALSAMSRLNPPCGPSMHTEVWSRHFWEQVRGLRHIDIWNDGQLQVSAADLTVERELYIECCKPVPDADPTAVPAPLRAARTINLESDVVLELKLAYMMPTGEAIGWLLQHLHDRAGPVLWEQRPRSSSLAQPPSAGTPGRRRTPKLVRADPSTVTEKHHVRDLLLHHQYRLKDHRWFDDVQKVISDPDAAQKDDQLDFTGFMDRMVTAVVLVPYNDAEAIDTTVRRLQAGPPARQSGQSHRGATVNVEAIRKLGHLVRYASLCTCMHASVASETWTDGAWRVVDYTHRCLCGTYLQREWCVHVAVWMIDNNLLEPPAAYDTRKVYGGPRGRFSSGRDRVYAGGEALLRTPPKHSSRARSGDEGAGAAHERDRACAKQRFRRATGCSPGRQDKTTRGFRDAGRVHGKAAKRTRDGSSTRSAARAKKADRERKRRRPRLSWQDSAHSADSESEGEHADSPDDFKPPAKNARRVHVSAGTSSNKPARTPRTPSSTKQPAATSSNIPAGTSSSHQASGCQQNGARVANRCDVRVSAIDDVILETRDKLQRMQLREMQAGSRLKDLAVRPDGRGGDSVGLYVKHGSPVVGIGEVLCLLSRGAVVPLRLGHQQVQVPGGAQSYTRPPTSESPPFACGGAMNEPTGNLKANAYILRVPASVTATGSRRRATLTVLVACEEIDSSYGPVEVLGCYGDVPGQSWQHRSPSAAVSAAHSASCSRPQGTGSKTKTSQSRSAKKPKTPRLQEAYAKGLRLNKRAKALLASLEDNEQRQREYAQADAAEAAAQAAEAARAAQMESDRPPQISLDFSSVPLTPSGGADSRLQQEKEAGRWMSAIRRTPTCGIPQTTAPSTGANSTARLRAGRGQGSGRAGRGQGSGRGHGRSFLRHLSDLDDEATDNSAEEDTAVLETLTRHYMPAKQQLHWELMKHGFDVSRFVEEHEKKNHEKKNESTGAAARVKRRSLAQVRCLCCRHQALNSDGCCVHTTDPTVRACVHTSQHLRRMVLTAS